MIVGHDHVLLPFPEVSRLMIVRIVELSLVQRFLICALGFSLLFGGLYAFQQLDIVAYPDPSPPMVEVITQFPGWSAEEIERQITIPIEVALNGMPGLTDIRSLSIFGLSDVKIYFDFGTQYFFDRQEVINRLATVSLPQNVQPALSPWWAIAEIYRYELAGDGKTSLTDLKTIQDWQVRREFRRVPGIIDVTAFGGTTQEYHVDIDPGKLISYQVSLAQVMEALTNSNANVGGNYLTVGAQNYNIRGLGLINGLPDIENVMVAEKEGTPIFVKTLGTVSVGHRVRLGKVGIDDNDDVVEGVILLQRGYKALSVLERVREKVEELNKWKLPEGVKVKTFYDRTALIHTTVETVTDILISGMVLVFVILFVFLGHFRASLIVALTIPMSPAVHLHDDGDDRAVRQPHFARLDRFRHHRRCHPGNGGKYLFPSRPRSPSGLDRAAADRARGSPGWAADILFDGDHCGGVHSPVHDDRRAREDFCADVHHLWLLPCSVRCSWLLRWRRCCARCCLTGVVKEEDTRFVGAIRRTYLAVLQWALRHNVKVIGAALLLLVGAFGALQFIGGEFMPALEEGNLWVRATMPVDISYDEAARLTGEIRQMFRQSPEVVTIVSQLGRPDDGTDPTSFFNAEFLANLKPQKEWRPGLSKDQLVEEIEARLRGIPGIVFNFSQVIQDNVEEAMSGVKGENSIKLFGNDLKTMEAKAVEVEAVMKGGPRRQGFGNFPAGRTAESPDPGGSGSQRPVRAARVRRQCGGAGGGGRSGGDPGLRG
jgi:cobalt-zinc-cadmium resistance protein CzcA